MPTPTKLSVIVNRYLHLDQHGRPAAAPMLDVPGAPPGNPRYIGATFKAEVIAENRAAFPNLNLPKQDSWLEYVDGPVDVLDTDHHRMYLRTGEVFAADEKTWKRVFPGHKEFVPGDELLRRARVEAIEEWKREHGGEEPSFVAIEAEREASRAKVVPTATETTPSTVGAAAENG